MTAEMTTAAVVLAAGLSTRFAGDKLVHPYRGRPLAAHIADTLLNVPVDFRLAVCPAGNAGRQEIFRQRGFEIVENDNPGVGLSSSLIAGTRRVLELGAGTMLVCLADMPHVSSGHLMALLAEVGAGAAIAASQNGETRSPPAAFGRASLEQLLTLEGDSGARALLAGARAVPMPPALAADFDTREDFARA